MKFTLAYIGFGFLLAYIGDWLYYREAIPLKGIIGAAAFIMFGAAVSYLAVAVGL